MDNKKKLQIVTLFFGLFFAGGFALGGIASYGSLISTPGGNSDNGNNQNQPATLPTENFKVGQYNLTLRDRERLAARNDVVFASLLYNTTEQKQQLEEIQGVENNFNGRMFVEVVNKSETTMFVTMGDTTPRAVLVSARQNAAVVPNPTQSSVAEAGCSSLINWGDTASYCSQYQ